jgi:hypothetical protein
LSLVISKKKNDIRLLDSNDNYISPRNSSNKSKKIGKPEDDNFLWDEIINRKGYKYNNYLYNDVDDFSDLPNLMDEKLV